MLVEPAKWTIDVSVPQGLGADMGLRRGLVELLMLLAETDVSGGQKPRGRQDCK